MTCPLKSAGSWRAQRVQRQRCTGPSAKISDGVAARPNRNVRAALGRGRVQHPPRWRPGGGAISKPTGSGAHHSRVPWLLRYAFTDQFGALVGGESARGRRPSPPNAHCGVVQRFAPSCPGCGYCPLNSTQPCSPVSPCCSTDRVTGGRDFPLECGEGFRIPRPEHTPV